MSDFIVVMERIDWRALATLAVTAVAVWPIFERRNERRRAAMRLRRRLIGVAGNARADLRRLIPLLEDAKPHQTIAVRLTSTSLDLVRELPTLEQRLEFLSNDEWERVMAMSYAFRDVTESLPGTLGLKKIRQSAEAADHVVNLLRDRALLPPEQDDDSP